MMQQGIPPQPKKKTSTLTVVLIVIGAGLVLLAGVCGISVIALQHEAKKIADDMGDGGLILVSPPDVKEALAGPKKDYVGQWKSKKGSALKIDADGRMLLEKDEDADGIKEKIDGPIVSFSGNDIVQKPVITFTTHVSVAPHQNGDHWEMTADGIDFSRP